MAWSFRRLVIDIDKTIKNTERMEINSQNELRGGRFTMNFLTSPNSKNTYI